MKKVVIVLICILFVGYFSVLGIINSKGKEVFIEVFEAQIKQPVNLEKFSFQFPFQVRLFNLTCDKAKINEVDVSLSVTSLLGGTIGFNKISIRDAEIDIVKENGQLKTFMPLPQATSGKSLATGSGSSVSVSVSKQSGAGTKTVSKRRPFLIKRLILNNIRVNFIDKSHSPVFKSSLYGLKASIDNLGLPLVHKTRFKLSSDLKVGDFLLEDNLTSSGYIDFRNKSMDAKLDVVRIPLKSLVAYLPSLWKPENSGINDADIFLISDFKAEKNELTINGAVALKDIVFNEDQESIAKSFLTKAILGMYSKEKGYPEFDFTLTTRLDDPELDFSKMFSNTKFEVDNFAISIGKEAANVIIDSVTKTKDNASESVSDIVEDAVGKVMKAPQDAKDILKGTGKVFESIFSSEGASE